ncbi:autotransporter-associated beta strand repeat-containing protein [Methylobacterium sp. Leaf87]|uniref:autotransporter-associated beta strand repeat-containing protein n=1 Tax=Methylobacterium sp. Leaf87 TaxID=1736243 RepID=UPI000ADE0274|nr:autotransporter-associated beta strand repeat-containing protein [Methylobacterium sp. Leaf87]
MSVDSTAGSARLWGRGLLLASTALVGFRTRPAPKPTVLHVAASLLRERIGRLLTLAVETPAALVARLNPLRIRKVRPAARIGRRKLQETLRAVAVLAIRARGVLARSGLVAASLAVGTGMAHAQSSTWGGAGNPGATTTTGDYNLGTNWSTGTAPTAAGQSAVFAATGVPAVNVSAGPIAPASWIFNTDAQNYTITGARVNFGGDGIVNNASAGTTISIANVIGGTGGVQQLGAGTLTLTGANTYSGATTINAGILRISGGNAIANTGAVVLSPGGTFDVTASETVGSLAGTGGTVVIRPGQTLTTGGANTSTTYSGAINGAGGLVVAGLTGGSTATFGGALTQTGGFTVADASNVTIAATGSYVAAANGVVLNGGTFTNQGSVRVIGGVGGINAVTTSTTVGTTVNNAANAEIVGQASGVIQLQGNVTGAFTVGNAGRIQGIDFDGVTQHGTGALTVTNAGTGVIYGQNASNSGNGYGVGSDGGGALTLINQAGGTIVGRYGAVGSNAADRITNAGRIASGTLNADNTITAGGVAGIQLRAGGTVTNQNGGVIDSGGRGVSLGAAGTVDNQQGGIIRHTGTADNGTGNGAGVYASGNLILTNAGQITTTAGGFNDGVTVLGVAMITNTGTIQAANAAGIAIAGAGSRITNSGTIQGGTGSVGVKLNNGGTITNSGAIQGAVHGIDSSAALTLTNLGGGTISGDSSNGVVVRSGASTVLNAGTITSTMNSGIAVGAGTLTVDNYGSIGSGALGITAFGSGALTANLYAGSATGSILGTGGNDTVSIYTGTGTNGTGATTTDPVTGQTVVLQAAGTNAAATVGAIALGTGSNTLNLRGTGDGTAPNGAAGAYGAVISGSTSVNKLDTGTFVLSGANTYSGATTISGGILNIQNATALGTTAAGTTVQSSGTLQLQNNITVTGEALSLAGNGSTGSNGALQNVSGANTYAGAIILAGASRINSDAGTLTLSGGIGGANQNLTVGGAGATTISGAIATGTGTFTKDGAGTVTLTGVNTYTGATTINAGTLTLNNAAGTALANTSRVTFGNVASTAATLQAQTSETIGSLSGGNTSSTVNIAAGTTLTVGGDNTTDGTYAGAINANNTGILAKTGTGTQTLTGAMTGGALVANQGTLALGTGGSSNTAGVAGLVPGATGGQAQAAVLVNSGAIFNNAGTITASNQGVALQGGTLNNTGGVTAANQSGVFALTGAVAITNTGTGSISGVNGIDANLTTASAISITGTGSVTGTGGFGIRAVSNGGNVVLGTTGAALGAVSGAGNAIQTSSTGTGTVSVVTGGNITSTGGNGIAASTVNGTVTVTVTSGAIATTNGSGLVATGTTGAVAVTANGAIAAGGAGNAGVFLTGNNVGNTATVANGITVQGAIGLRVAGTGTTALVNNGTLATTGGAGANAIQIDGGTLVVGNNAGTVTGNLAVVNAGSTLSVDRTADLALANVVTGAGTLNKGGAARLTLTGVNGVTNQFTGTVNVTAGTLAVNGTLGDTAGNAATVNVATGATLNGTGTIAGSVVVNTGATVSAGNSPGTLTIGGNYTLNAGSTSLFELGAPGVVGGLNNDLIVVRGNLQLGGTLSLVSAANAAVAPVSGVYRLFDYGGALTGAFGTVLTPTGTTSTASVFTTVPNQVNLLIANANAGGGGGGGGAGPVTPVTPVTPVNPGTPVIPVTPGGTGGGQAVQFWDGADTGGALAGVQGGSGTWAAGATNWTTVTGDANTAWRSGVGIFSGTAGVVTVAGAQGVQGLQFTTDGYALAGAGTLTLLGDVTSPTRSFVNVDAGVGATIANALTGATGEIGLNKLGTGTLTLTGASTYTGPTQAAAGTLVVAAGGALASAVTVDTGASLVNAGTLGAGLTNAGSASNSGTVAARASNTGRLANTGTINGGLVNATGATTNAGTINGGATIVSGSLTTTGIVNGAVANGGTIRAQGQLNGPVANQAGAAFIQTGALTGIGRLTNDGTVDLGGNDLGIGSLAGTNAGARIVNGGTLSAGSDGASTAFAGAITGTTALTKTGAGTLTLSGANTSTGTTRVQAGGLINTGSLAGGVGNAGIFTNTGSVAGALANGGTVLTSGTLAGGLSNTGDVTALAGRIDGAVLNTAGTLSITGRVAGNGTLSNAAAATLAVSGTYDLAGLLTNAGGLTVASGGALTAPAGIVNSGAITVAQGGTITDALANTGRVVNDGTYNADVSNAGPGTLANRATGVWNGNLTANTASLTNAGLWQGNARNDVGGTLANGGTWTTASAPIANAGTLSNTGTVNGGVANSGGFTNAGTLNGGLSNLAGTTTNTGAINGAVAVTGGSLATTGTLNGALTNAATVTASGRIAGSVTNLAGASFTLTGPLSGVTRLSNDGTVDLGGTALSVGSLSGTNIAAVLRNGTLTAAGDDTTTYAGTITDGAATTALVKAGTGTLTLTGANTFTGGTTILSGTLVASAANLGGGPVTNNNTLVIDQAGDATLSDTINGTGRFIKQGAGSLTYTGTGTLSGATLISAGRLSVNGSLANSVVTVASAASLGGTGVVGGVVVNGGGAVAPGASPGTVGTLRVAGNILFASQSLYQLDATASGQSDRIVASGTAALQGGTVQVTAQPGLYAPSTRYTILTAAGGLTGQFANVTANFAFLTPTLAYGNTDVTLQLARNDIAFGTTAQTRNQGAVAAAAQATGPGARLYDAIAVLSAPQSRAAYDALSGEIHASAITAQFETATLIREAVLDRLRWGDSAGFGSGVGSQGIGQRFAPGTTVPAAYTADLPGRAPSLSMVPARFVDPQPITAWGQGFGAFGSTATNGNAARLDRQTSGFVLGADARVENDWRIGAAGGYTITNLDITGRLSTGSVESGYGALYAGGGAGPLQVRLGASYGGNSLTTRRAVIFAGVGENAGARYGGSTAQGFAETGYRFGTALGYVEPFLGGAVIRIGRNAFNETGGASALTAAGRDYDLATSTVGVRAEAQLGAVLGSDLPILVRALVGYRRAYGDVVPSALLAFSGGQSFVTAGIPIDRDAVVGQAGLDWQVARGTTLGVAYTGQVGTRAQDHGVKGNFTLRF